MERLVALVVIVPLLTAPSNWAVRWVLGKARGVSPDPIPGAGRWIGSLERIVIFLLIMLGQPSGAGWVIGAKAVLRYPEITGEHRTIDPEYVLVGSLTSWLIALFFGVVAAFVVW